MHLDVVEIRDFYARPLGKKVRRYIGQQIRSRWPSGDGWAMAGVGYAGPYMRHFLPDSDEIVLFSPAEQGGLIWPSEGPRRVALVDEDMLPVRDEAFDRVLIVHGLEFFADVDAHLREVWRVMRPEGRLLVVVPNRSGLWARLDTTPFGYGHPFSRGQLHDLLVRCWFRPLQVTSLVHFAPFQTPLRLTASPTFEKIGAKVWPRFSGMLMVEAVKELAQPIRPKGAKVKAVKDVPIRVQPVPA